MAGENTLKKKTSYRAMTSLVTTWAFVIAAVSGVVLFIMPKGRVAYWIEWELFALTKEAWGELHLIFSVVFVIVGVTHLIYNWKPFKNYLAERVKDSTGSHVHVKKTVYGSLAIVFVFFALSLANLPPASWVFDLEDAIKESWVADPDFEPPFGHAEEVSLPGFSQRQFIDLSEALAALKVAGIEVPDKRMKLKDIAALNSITPLDVYRAIKHLEKRPDIKSRLTPADVEARFAGTGLGRKTLVQVAEELSMDSLTAQARLKRAGVEADAKDKLKAIAEKHGMEPSDMVKILLIEGYRP